MKKKITLILIVLCLITVILGVTYKVNADSLFSDIQNNPGAYIQSDGDNSGAVEVGNIIVWLVRTIGQAISVIILMIIGIKYVLGSVEEKAEYKKTMWVYILGAVLIFLGASLTNIIYEALNGK